MANRRATRAYLHALNNMANTRPGNLARMADRMAGDAFDRRDYQGFHRPSSDAMMSIETSVFVGLCEANGVDWRLIVEPA